MSGACGVHGHTIVRGFDALNTGIKIGLSALSQGCLCQLPVKHLPIYYKGLSACGVVRKSVARRREEANRLQFAQDRFFRQIVSLKGFHPDDPGTHY
jgi:hypothetical protein